jgi:hypothetical protein
MAEINTLYASLLAADEARDPAALTAVAWQMYGQLATTTTDLGALRARFRVYAAAPHTSRTAHQRQAAGPTSSPGRRLRGCVAGRRSTQGDVSADEKSDRRGVGVAGHRGTTSTMGPAVAERSKPGHHCLPRG